MPISGFLKRFALDDLPGVLHGKVLLTVCRAHPRENMQSTDGERPQVGTAGFDPGRVLACEERPPRDAHERCGMAPRAPDIAAAECPFRLVDGVRCAFQIDPHISG